ncbi:MAG TPA: DnaB-like helicase C-terminal domain-containing protein, partial [Longimicrobiaceae bacterium]|nr:DnaB-like helicase C-terminal domain-containing protein [Longimicrobiaceae bacterium]
EQGASMTKSGTADGTSGIAFSPLKEHLWPAMEGIEQRSNLQDRPPGVTSGFKDLNLLTSGWSRGDLIILGGATGMGKSALALHFAVSAALADPQPVAIVTLEQDEQACVMRMLCAGSRVSTLRVKSGRLRDDDFPPIAMAAGLLNQARIHILHSARLFVDQLGTELRQLAQHEGLGLVMVDGLNLLRVDGFAPPATNREQEVGIIVRELKALALELKVPIVATASLSRAVEQRPGKRPMLPDLRDSGDVENTADVVLFLYRPAYYYGPEDGAGNSIENTAELIVAKHRSGQTGTLDLLWLPASASFVELVNDD